MIIYVLLVIWLYKEKLNRINTNYSPLSMNTDRIRPLQKASAAAISYISIIADHDVCISEPCNSSSETSDQEMSNIVPQYQREKSTAVLNDVFRLVGQSTIVDIRNRTILRQKVHDAVAATHKVAEEIL